MDKYIFQYNKEQLLLNGWKEISDIRFSKYLIKDNQIINISRNQIVKERNDKRVNVTLVGKIRTTALVENLK